MLTFSRLRNTNVARCKRWHVGFPNDEDWLGSDWSNAMAGEAGEACNVVKKLRRQEVGFAPHGGVIPENQLRDMLAEEIADTVIYADLLAAKYGIDLGEAITNKFNLVSADMNFPERL